MERSDDELRERFQTVELIVERLEWRPRRNGQVKPAMVSVRLDRREHLLRRAVRSAGGRWEPASSTWTLRYEAALELGLRDRIVRKQRGRQLATGMH